MKPPEEIDDTTFILVDIAAKARSQMREFVAGLLRDRMEADRLARLLTEGKWIHDYPITPGQAREFGLPVTPALPGEIYRLMDPFPRAMPRRPSVACIPVPCGEGEEKQVRRTPAEISGMLPPLCGGWRG